MELTHIQGAITYLENNKDEYAQVMLDNGLMYSTKHMKLLDDVVYVTTDHITGKDVAIVPAMTINHIVIKNSNIDKVMGFDKINE